MRHSTFTKFAQQVDARKEEQCGGYTKMEPNTSSSIQVPQAYVSFLQSNNLGDDQSSETLYQVYQDLLRIRQWTNVRISHRASRAYIVGYAAAAFDSVYGDEQANDPHADRTQAVIPVRACEWLPVAQLYDLCSQCVHPDTGDKLRCVTLAIVDDDSTTAYYRLLNEWQHIVDTRWKTKKVTTEQGEDVEASQSCSDTE